MTLSDLQAKKNQQKISCLTAYDALFAKIVDDSEVDIVLIGDSLGMVIQGAKDTLGVSMVEMVYHTKIVAKQCRQSFVIADMPYQSYQTPKIALNNARQLIDAGADMVKLEGGQAQSKVIKILFDNQITVCGHLGLQPQSIKELGGYKVQGRRQNEAKIILDDAKYLEQLGIGLLIVECIPSKLAKTISQQLTIPVIGIGAGIDCDGQVLVSTDILGLGKLPSFAKNFLIDNHSIKEAVKAFDQAVKAQTFPGKQHSFY